MNKGSKATVGEVSSPAPTTIAPETLFDDKVRSDYVPKAAYLDPAFARLEEERLWPRVWQIAGREEELPRTGSFITYDIGDESITVVRLADGGLKAYFNVCPHRGRPLTDGAGTMREFFCRYHGWRWNLAGENIHVVDRDDWGPCLRSQDIALKPVQVASWGGFIFVNFDPSAGPLADYLQPFNELCAKYEFEKMRFRWYRTTEFGANWKTVLEGFNEAYHVQTSHPQLLSFIEDYTNSGAFGPHSAFWYDPLPDNMTRYKPSSRLGRSVDPDYRQYIMGYVREMHEQLGAAITPRAFHAAERMMEEVPADATSGEVLMRWRQLWQEAAEAEGAGWPSLTPDEIRAARQDWHIFPNAVFLLAGLDGLLMYRARPFPGDPDRCYFDVWSLVRYGPGDEPPLKREYYANWRDCKWGRILSQDFANLERVQRGMKSRGFRGARPNPVQERPVSNFHRSLHEFVEK